MRLARASCWLVLVAVCACSKQQSTAERAQPATPPAAALAPPPTPAPPKATATQRQEAGLGPHRPSRTRPNEDGSETVEETTGDSGSHNPLLAAVASTVASPASAATTT